MHLYITFIKEVEKYSYVGWNVNYNEEIICIKKNDIIY